MELSAAGAHLREGDFEAFEPEATEDVGAELSFRQSGASIQRAGILFAIERSPLTMLAARIDNANKGTAILEEEPIQRFVHAVRTSSTF